MITESVFNAAKEITSALKARGLRVIPKEGSVITVLDQSTISATAVVNATTQSSLLNAENIIADSRATGSDGGVRHDEVLSQIGDNESKVLTSLLSLCRTELKADTLEVIEMFDREMDGMSVKIDDPYSVVPNVYHRLWGLTQFQMLVDRYKNTPFEVFRFGGEFPEMEEFDLLKYLRVGVTSIDEVINDWIHDRPAGRIAEVYKRVFVNKTAFAGRQVMTTGLTEDGFDRNDVLTVMLLAQGMLKNIPDNVNIPLSTLENILANVMASSGRIVNQILARREYDDKANLLIHKTELVAGVNNKFTRTLIHVNNDVYQRYLEEGYSVDAIYGAVQTKSSISYDYIVANQSKLVGAFERFKRIYNQELGSVLLAGKKEALRLAFTKFINKLEEDKLPADRAQVHGHATKCVQALEAIDIQDMPRAIRDLVCDVMYPTTNAKLFLHAMDTAEIENPGLTPREYALLAQIDLVARMVAANLKAVKY